MVRVNNDYVIEIDSLNYTVKRDLHRKKIVKNPITGKESEEDYYRTVGYYSDMTSAIKGVISDMNYQELSSGVHDLEEALSIILKNNKLISDLLEKVLEV